MSSKENLRDLNILVITGAIDIYSMNVPFTSIVDQNERIDSYIFALEYAIENYKRITHIIFCENTNYKYDYSSLCKQAKKQKKVLEILTFFGNYDAIIKQGKGYGEGEILKHVIEKSKYISCSSSFYKLTGRLILLNMDKIVASTRIESAFDLFPKSIYNNPKDFVSTIFYKVDREFYQNVLVDSFKDVDDAKGRYLENVFLERLSKYDIYSFRILPYISGKSGSTGLFYDLSDRSKLNQRFLYFLGIHNIKKKGINLHAFKVIEFLFQLRYSIVRSFIKD